MKKLLFAIIVIASISGIRAQGYYELDYLSNPGNPRKINTDADFTISSNFNTPPGTTKIIGHTVAPKYSSVQTLPFAFNFNGGPVTQFKASSGGYITFSKIAVTPALSLPQMLPSAQMADSSICVWGLCTAGLSGVGEVYTKVYGTAPNRQLWICWFAATNPLDTSSINFWSIVLEETTNNIYMVDESGSFFWNNQNFYLGPDLAVGIQISPSLAYEVINSPLVQSLVNNNTSGSNSFNDYYEFSPGTQPAYAATVINSNISDGVNTFYGVGKPYPVNALVGNAGSTTLSGLTINWSADGGPVNASAVSTSIAVPNPVSQATVASSINWVPASAGLHSMKIWATQLNGNNPNQNIFDTLFINNIKVIDSLQPKTTLLEEFTQASCEFCMTAAPNLDSVLINNKTTCVPIRYHVSWPGVDYMNQATWLPYDSERTFSYYGITGVPEAELDGTILLDSRFLKSTDLQPEVPKGSPFKITITSCTYNPNINVYNVQASIKSYGNFSAGLAANAVLTVDTLKYDSNQSTEDPDISFAPPIGSGTNADSYYQFLVNFPEVVEDMMTGEKGQSLSAFTVGQTQTINVNWTKSHAWGAENHIWKYDSLPGEHITVFVQDNSTKYVYQVASAPVKASITGVEKIIDDTSFKMYPNPTNKNTTIVFTIEQPENVGIEIYNTLGEKVCSVNEGTMGSGEHTILINGQDLKSGIYLVQFTTDHTTTVQRLIIEQ